MNQSRLSRLIWLLIPPFVFCLLALSSKPLPLIRTVSVDTLAPGAFTDNKIVDVYEKLAGSRRMDDFRAFAASRCLPDSFDETDVVSVGQYLSMLKESGNRVDRAKFLIRLAAALDDVSGFMKAGGYSTGVDSFSVDPETGVLYFTGEQRVLAHVMRQGGDFASFYRTEPDRELVSYRNRFHVAELLTGLWDEYRDKLDDGEQTYTVNVKSRDGLDIKLEISAYDTVELLPDQPVRMKHDTSPAQKEFINRFKELFVFGGDSSLIYHFAPAFIEKPVAFIHQNMHHGESESDCLLRIVHPWINASFLATPLYRALGVEDIGLHHYFAEKLYMMFLETSQRGRNILAICA